MLTLGPGDHPFFKFGHDAIWIHDASDGSDRVYNFGTFTFDSPQLIVDFLHGRMTYWLSVSGIGATVAAYEHENRSIDVQELALDPAVKRALKDRLDVNAQPQNRAYKYDYFADNCATRVRDAVDWAAGGRLHAAGRAPARLSLRDQALRMTVSYLPLYLGIDLVLGPAADRPIDRWGEMFIPEELAAGLGGGAAAERGGRDGPAGRARHDAVPGAPRAAAAPAAAAARGVLRCGPLVGALFWLLGRSASAGELAAGVRIAARVAMGVVLSLWGLVVGFVGCFLIYVWGWTDHAVAHRTRTCWSARPGRWRCWFWASGSRSGGGGEHVPRGPSRQRRWRPPSRPCWSRSASSSTRTTAGGSRFSPPRGQGSRPGSRG